MLGVQHAYAPLSPFYRVPFLALVSEVTEKPVVRDGEIVARPMLTVSVTMDHRYLDGAHAARLARSARAYLDDPAGPRAAAFPVAARSRERRVSATAADRPWLRYYGDVPASLVPRDHVVRGAGRLRAAYAGVDRLRLP